MTVPLFDVARAPRSVLEMVMAGLVAQVDGGDVVYLTEDYTRASADLPDGAAETLRGWVESGRVRLGAPVTARVGAEVLRALLLIGPFDTAPDDQEEA
jgi:hypothetical protein